MCHMSKRNGKQSNTSINITLNSVMSKLKGVDVDVFF